MRPVDAKIPVTLGYRQKMRSRPSYIHRGVDFGAPVGSTVRASKGGKVVHAGRGGMGPAFGIHVVVKTSEGIYVIVAHLSSESVSVGQQVVTGDVLGKSGATGNVTGPHVHYGEFTAYSYLADRKPQYLDDKPAPAPKPKPASKVVRHFEHRHLNTWGDDGAKGTDSFFKRVDPMFDALVKGRPEVITLNEAQGDDVASWKKRFKAAGYDVALAEAGNLVAVPAGSEVRKAQSKYLPDSIQGEGRKEALGMVRAKINGHWEHIFAAHLEYRNGTKYDAIRVKQAKWIADEAKRWAEVFELGNWQMHTTIGIDENSGSWVRDKAFTPAGIKVAVKSGIDAIYGNRAVMGKRTIATKSDHPIVAVVYGKTVK